MNGKNMDSRGRLLNYYRVGDKVKHVAFEYMKEAVVTSMVASNTFPTGISVSVECSDGTKLTDVCASDFWPFYEIKEIKLNLKIKKSIDHYPHRCPKCNGKAFIGFNQVDCMLGCYKK